MMEHIEQGTLPAHVKACIALTSWKKRINTVGLTIYNLLETCGLDYHIVLTLAEEEFPKKEQELPRDLVLMNRAGVFEILWCKRNWRSFKKWVFAGMKYPKVPIITADDDCLYGVNYADEFYKFYMNNWKRAHIYYCSPGEGSGWGYLFPPNIFGYKTISNIEKIYKISPNDDLFYVTAADKLHIPRICINVKSIAACHDTVEPINIGREYAAHPERRQQDMELFAKIIKV